MNVDLPAVFGIGVMTLVTPCILPLLPIYLGMLLGSSVESIRGVGGRFRLLASTTAFAFGFGLVFTLLGFSASAAGRFLQGHRSILLLAGGTVIVLFGLKYLGLLRVPFLDRELRLPDLRSGRRLVDATLFGVVFALGWTPCVGPILGSVLTYTASRTADPAAGALYLGVYSLGVATPLIALSLFIDRLLPFLERLKRHIPTFEKLTGVALVTLGTALLLPSLPLSSWMDRADREQVPVAGYHDPRPFEPALGAPSEKPRVVEFYRHGCSACEKARERVEELRSDCTNRRIEILTIDAEAAGNRELAKRYEVAVVPTFLLLDTEGSERGRMVGAPELTDLRGAAAALMAETCAGVVDVDLSEFEALDDEGIACPGEGEAAIGTEGLLPLPDEGTCQG